ncbi:sigma factor-like helix-turn-helix DNA-binding protein [Spirillospora sp. NPDC047418]
MVGRVGVRLCRAGSRWTVQTTDEEAFRLLYRDLNPRLLRYLRVLGVDEADRVAAQVWRQLAREPWVFRGGDCARLRGRAAAIARNQAGDHVARMSPAHSACGAGDAAAPHRPVLTVAEGEVSTDEAIALIAALPGDQAEALLLRVVIGLDATAAARVMGTSTAAVRTASVQALSNLAHVLGGCSGRRDEAGACGDTADDCARSHK